MASGKTTHYRLSQWAGTDPVVRTDFNEDNARLDAALHQHAVGLSAAWDAVETLQSNALPAGVICLWSGAADAVPSGWALCDGQNGTPDLRDKFVVGAGSGYAVGATGGEATHTLTVKEMPSHNHYIYQDNSAGTNNSYGYRGLTNCLGLQATTSTGGGQAHNNLPPYYALCYIIKI